MEHKTVMMFIHICGISFICVRPLVGEVFDFAEIDVLQNYFCRMQALASVTSEELWISFHIEDVF